MIIGRKILELSGETGAEKILICVYAPELEDGTYFCRYEIHWPMQLQTKAVGGVDGIDAILGACYMIGSDLYFSDYHKKGLLKCNGKAGDFGFPLHSGLRDGVSGYVDL